MGLSQTILTILVSGRKLRPAELGRMIQKSRGNVQDALFRLTVRGYAISMGGIYAATPEGEMFLASGEEIKSGPAGVSERKVREVKGTVRDKVWRAMRIKRKFGLDDLARAVLDGTEKSADPTDNIKKFVGKLEKSGYLIEMKRRTPGSAPTSNGFKRWMLIRDTGPKTPICRISGVYDPNEETEFPYREAK